MAETNDNKPNGRPIRPGNHFRTHKDGTPIRSSGTTPRTVNLHDEKFIASKAEHFIRDLNDVQNQDPLAKDRAVVWPDSEILGAEKDNPRPVFSGSTTNVNPFADPEKQKIIDYGLSNYEEERLKEAGDYKPPLSPLYPFTRMIDITSRNDHQISNLMTFNRYHIPVADLEHRKAFRHLFFTRPECYLTCLSDGKIKMCQQAEYDEDFNTSYSRMPYITHLLSPVYVSGTFGLSGISGDNINYLLSNRCTGLAPTGGTLSTHETIGKSIQGYTVTPGMHYEGRQGSTISVTFRDTKYLEVYEYFRMWMLYIWKIKYGIFAPSFNGYQYTNGFPTGNTVPNFSKYHPLDRALDYTVSMFDFVMDESDSFVRYWCKYFGMYPIDVQIEGLGNSNNDALKNEMTVTVTFKYQYKIENTTKTLIEFNYNCGICDGLGQPTEAGKDNLEYLDQFKYVNNPESEILKEYVGAGSPFVGTPYIVMMNVGKDVLKNTETHSVVWPCLRFSPLRYAREFDRRINMGLNAAHINKDAVIQSSVTAVKEAAAVTDAKIRESNSSGSMLGAIVNLEVAVANAALSSIDNAIDDIFLIDD